MVVGERLRQKYHDTIEYLKDHEVYKYLFIAEGLTVGGGGNDTSRR